MMELILGVAIALAAVLIWPRARKRPAKPPHTIEPPDNTTEHEATDDRITEMDKRAAGKPDDPDVASIRDWARR